MTFSELVMAVVETSSRVTRLQAKSSLCCRESFPELSLQQQIGAGLFLCPKEGLEPWKLLQIWIEKTATHCLLYRTHSLRVSQQKPITKALRKQTERLCFQGTLRLPEEQCARTGLPLQGTMACRDSHDYSSGRNSSTCCQ